VWHLHTRWQNSGNMETLSDGDRIAVLFFIEIKGTSTSNLGLAQLHSL